MDSRLLKAFVSLAEDLHFARTADRLDVAQSVLSDQLKKLETALGVRLLNRNKRSAVTLTDAGALFLREAVLAIRQLERAESVGKLAARGEIGNVSLGYVGSAVSTARTVRMSRWTSRRWRRHGSSKACVTAGWTSASCAPDRGIRTASRRPS
jgi:DNA-binding transcriptional LysR family regulator